MTVSEFSNGFDTLVDSYRRFKDFDKQDMLDSIEFNEYEKSFFLTMAQDEMVLNLYNGKNIYGDSFESTEEMRRYLDELVRTDYPDMASNEDAVSKNSVFYSLPDDLSFIVYEQVTLDDESLGCFDGSIANVYPITHDEYNKVRRNPFRGATKYKVLRLDSGEHTVELISKYKFNKYMIRYISKPAPIILEKLGDSVSIHDEHNVSDCTLNPVLHDAILRRAVQLALTTKGIQINN